MLDIYCKTHEDKKAAQIFQEWNEQAFIANGEEDNEETELWGMAVFLFVDENQRNGVIIGLPPKTPSLISFVYEAVSIKGKDPAFKQQANILKRLLRNKFSYLN